MNGGTESGSAKRGTAALEKTVLPATGVALPVVWGNLGKQLVDAGVVDMVKLDALYAARGGLPQDMKSFLDGGEKENIIITQENAGTLLNLLWALGLSNKNRILDTGPMRDPRYGGAGNFASTGGWTLADSGAMSHYGAHSFVTLTADEQALAERVAKNIYRPCCDNPTYFPDCNHGMAMLGLLELMASQDATETQMYQAAFAANSYWFPNEYMNIARYLERKGIAWNSVEPKDLLGANVSSASAYRQIVAELESSQHESSQNSSQNGSSNGCGV